VISDLVLSAEESKNLKVGDPILNPSFGQFRSKNSWAFSIGINIKK